MAKGKTIFTMEEYKKIKGLVSQLEKADRQKAKSIRNKIRNIGLYWSEVAGGMEYTVSNLNHLFSIGTLKISNGSVEEIDNEKISKKIEDKSLEMPEISEIALESKDIEEGLINGVFLAVNELENGVKVPNVPGIYCIKLRKDIVFPKDFGKIREDGVIYIGIASKSLKERLWEEELNHQRPATFFRSVGAMLGFLPPKGSLIGKKNKRNYKFNSDDTEKIRKWMQESLLVNFLSLPSEEIEPIESSLIEKLAPLVNLKHNPCASEEIKKARQKCVEWANSGLS